jgi:hypothetical protein
VVFFGGLWKVSEKLGRPAGSMRRGPDAGSSSLRRTVDGVRDLQRGWAVRVATRRPTGSRAAGGVFEAALFGGLWKMLSSKYEVDHGLRQGCSRSAMEWCFGAVK